MRFSASIVSCVWRDVCLVCCACFRPTEVPRSSITLLDDLGCGEYGLVKRGLYTSGIVPEFEVAVKMLQPMPTDSDRSLLLREAALTSQFDHPNVIALIGVVTIGDPIMMVLQYCAEGSLRVGAPYLEVLKGNIAIYRSIYRSEYVPLYCVFLFFTFIYMCAF